MTRSLKKGPYIDFRLRKKIDIMNDSGKDDDGSDAGKKDENVVDADFEEVKDENKEKSA